jgi:hypothetical protein
VLALGTKALGVVRRLISTPMNANGAHEANAQGMPLIPTMVVANWRLRTKGAMSIAREKMKCDTSQPVRRSGLWSCHAVRIFESAGGGRGVKGRLESSGERIAMGSRMLAVKVTSEKITREREPMRPIAPRRSLVGVPREAEGV